MNQNDNLEFNSKEQLIATIKKDFFTFRFFSTDNQTSSEQIVFQENICDTLIESMKEYSYFIPSPTLFQFVCDIKSTTVSLSFIPKIPEYFFNRIDYVKLGFIETTISLHEINMIFDPLILLKNRIDILVHEFFQQFRHRDHELKRNLSTEVYDNYISKLQKDVAFHKSIIQSELYGDVMKLRVIDKQKNQNQISGSGKTPT